jgi:hypothetical protein
VNFYLPDVSLGDVAGDDRAGWDVPCDAAHVAELDPLLYSIGPDDDRARPGGELVPAGELPDAGLDGAATGSAFRHWLSLTLDSARAIGTSPSGPWHARPESLAQHAAYAQSRAWVPPGQDGAVLGPAGAAYHVLVATPVMFACYLLAWVAGRPMRLFIAAALCGGIALGFWLGG